MLTLDRTPIFYVDLDQLSNEFEEKKALPDAA
jgi:hypothetical protein